MLPGNSYYKSIVRSSLCGDRCCAMSLRGFSVSGATLTRFFSLHFLFPFILAVLVGVHLVYLHVEGSNSPVGS